MKKASQKETRWCQCLPRWRRHCAKSVTPMPAKPRQLLRCHLVVLKPLSWRAVKFLSTQFAQFAAYSTCLFSRWMQLSGYGAVPRLMTSTLRRLNDFGDVCIVTKQLLKFGGLWRYRFCAMASPNLLVRGSELLVRPRFG